MNMIVFQFYSDNFSSKIIKFLIFVFMLIFLIFSTVGCTPSNVTEATKSANATIPVKTVDVISNTTVEKNTVGSSNIDFLYRWIKGIPCRPPCWEGITPGKTNDVEAVKLLSQISLIPSNTIRTLPPNGGMHYGLIGWNWNTSNLDLKARVGVDDTISFDETPQKLVYSIWITFSGYKFNEIISNYGEPSHIIATDETNSEPYSTPKYKVRFIYLNQGFFIETSFSTIMMLTADMEVKNPNFFRPGLEGFTDIRLFSAEYLVPWQGFKSFDFYCKQQLNGKVQSCQFLNKKP